MKHMAKVWEMEGIPSTEKLVLLALADYASHNENVAFVRTEKLARKCGLSGRTSVRKVLKRLEEKALILIIHKERDDGGSAAPHYQLMLEKIDQELTPPDSESVGGRDSERVTPLTPKASPPDSEGVTPRLPGRPPYYNITNQEFNQESNLLGQPEKNKNLLDWFENIFWKTWPKKLKKKRAWEQMKKLKPDEDLRAKIIQVIPMHHAAVSDLQYLCAPDRWISEERWEDEVHIPNVSGKPSVEQTIAQRRAQRKAGNFSTVIGGEAV